MKTVITTILLVVTQLSTAQHPVNHLVIWVDGVVNHGLNPSPPQGFYHDPQWFPEYSTCPYPDIGTIGNEYGNLYDGECNPTPDPNVGVHFVEFQPDREHESDSDCTGGDHLFWNNNSTRGHYLFGSPAVWMYHDETKDWWLTDRVYGGDNQAYNPTVPPQYQAYTGGTIWIYEDPNWSDFADWWCRYHPAYDFNKDGFVNIVDLRIYIENILFKRR
jgi:hypothetical protein